MIMKKVVNLYRIMQLDLGDDYIITNSAYTQARAKLNYTAFEEFVQISVEQFYKDDDYTTYNGLRVLAIDGSIVTLPNSDDIFKEFNPIKVRCQIKEYEKDVAQAMLLQIIIEWDLTDMFGLLLMVRATILKFSSEVSEIAKKIDNKNISDDVSELYKRYIQFVNGFYFREITAKDQGLELYEKALDILSIPREIKDLDAEIDELHKYIEIKQRKVVEKANEKTNKKLEKIQLYGGVLLGTSVLTGFFGMNVGSNLVCRINNYSFNMV